MLYLLPTSSSLDHYPLGGRRVRLPQSVGVMTTPGRRSIPLGIREGRPYAVDNEVYSGHYEFGRFLSYLERLKPWRENCLFVTVPDTVGDARATLINFDLLWWYIAQLELPVAFVAQDGQENYPWPEGGFSTVFIGGSTAWKMSQAALSVMERAIAEGYAVHVGRVNSSTRYNHMLVAGASSVDGTCLAYARDAYTQRIVQWGQRQALPRPESPRVQRTADCLTRRPRRRSRTSKGDTLCPGRARSPGPELSPGP